MRRHSGDFFFWKRGGDKGPKMGEVVLYCLVYTLKKGKELSEHFIKFSFKGGNTSRNELVLD